MQLCLDHILYHYLKEYHNSESIFGLVSWFMKKMITKFNESNWKKRLLLVKNMFAVFKWINILNLSEICLDLLIQQTGGDWVWEQDISWAIVCH